jgi:signal transduction histidine kinase
VPVTHQASAGRGLAAGPRHWLGLAGDLPRARWLAGLLLVAAALPLLTAVLTRMRSVLSLGSTLLLYLLMVVIVAVIGGTAPAFAAAVASSLLVNWFFVQPLHTWRISGVNDVISLVVFLVVAMTVSVLVDLAVRYRAVATRNRLESALRRVATLVAHGAEPQAVFDAVCEETGRLMGATTVNLAHFTPDNMNQTIAGWSAHNVHVPTGTRLPLDGENINFVVQRTGQPGRFDSYEAAAGPLAARLRELGIKNEVGAPVLVDGRVWGALIAGKDTLKPLPPGAETRLARFAELIATAVSNATTHAELVASRARIVTAAYEGRRRLARDLHDGAQQRLVSAVMSLQLADQRVDRDPAAARHLLREALGHARDGLGELRELAAGVHPSILTNRGLHAAVEALAQRSGVPVDMRVPDERYPPQVEAAAYFVIAEALTNVAKHAQASCASVSVDGHDGSLTIDVRDDGSGGADLRGSGLRGLKDRVEALGGGLRLDSPPGRGTHLHATVSLSSSY